MLQAMIFVITQLQDEPDEKMKSFGPIQGLEMVDGRPVPKNYSGNLGSSTRSWRRSGACDVERLLVDMLVAPGLDYRHRIGQPWFENSREP